MVIGKSGKAAVLWHGGHVQDRKTSPYISPGFRIWGRLGWVVYLPGVFVPHMLRLRHSGTARSGGRGAALMRGGLLAPHRFPQLAWLLTQEQGVLWILLPFYITGGTGAVVLRLDRRSLEVQQPELCG